MRGDREYIRGISTCQLGWWREGVPGSPYSKQRYICHRGVFFFVNGALTYVALGILGPRDGGKVVMGVGERWYGPDPVPMILLGRQEG